MISFLPFHLLPSSLPQKVDKFVAPTAESEQKVLSWLTSENVLSEKERTKFELGGSLEKLVRRSVLFWELKCTVVEAEALLAVNFFNFRNTEKNEGVIVRSEFRSFKNNSN